MANIQEDIQPLMRPGNEQQNDPEPEISRVPNNDDSGSGRGIEIRNPESHSSEAVSHETRASFAELCLPCLFSLCCFGEMTSPPCRVPYNGKISALVVMCAEVAIAAVASFTTYTTPQTSMVPHSIDIFFMLFAIILIIVAHLSSRCNRCQLQLVVWQPQASSSTDSKLSKVLRDYLVLIGIIIFYVLSLVLDIYHVVAERSCRDVWDECGPVVSHIYNVNIAYHVIRMIFMGCVTIFCLKFHDAKFKDNWCVSYVIATILAANLSIWIESLMYEINERDKKGEADNMFNLCDNDLVKHSTTNHTVRCFNHTNEEFTRLKQNISPYFYPVTIEFSLLVGEWLFHNYFKREIHNNSGEGDVIRNTLTSSHSSHPPTRVEQRGTDSSTLPVSQIFALFCIAINVVFCVLAFLDSDTILLTFRSVYKNVFFWYAIAYYVIMILSVFVGSIVSCESNGFKHESFSCNGLIAMVILSATGLIVQNIFRIIATFQLKECDFWTSVNHSCILPDYGNTRPPDLFVGPGLYLFMDSVNVIQVIFQVPFLCYCQFVSKPTDRNHKSRRLYNLVLAHLAVCNLSCWMVDSVLVVTDFSPTDIFFGVTLWKLLYNIFAPFTLFFRFNSMLFFARAFLRNEDGYDDRSSVPDPATNPVHAAIEEAGSGVGADSRSQVELAEFATVSHT